MKTKKTSKEQLGALMGTWSKMKGVPNISVTSKTATKADTSTSTQPSPKKSNSSGGSTNRKNTTKQRANKKGRILTPAQDEAAINELRFWVDDCLRSQKTASASTGEKDRVRVTGFARFLRICTPEVKANWTQYSSAESLTDIQKINLGYGDFNSGVASAMLWDSLFEPIMLNGKRSQFNKHLVQLQTRLQAIHENVQTSFSEADQLKALHDEIGKELINAKSPTDVITHLLATSYVLRSKRWW
jgi:hypothetical protein